MSDVLKRKLGAMRTPKPPVGASVEGVLRTTMPRDADAVLSLDVAVVGFSTATQEKAETLDGLRTSDLVLLLQSGESARGLAVLDAALVSGIIEVQVAGAVSPHQPMERVPTRTDGIFVSEVVDRWLATAEAAIGEAGLSAAWPLAGFERTPGNLTRREADLLLEPGEFRRVEIALSLDGGKRTGMLRLAVPQSLPATGEGATLAARVRGHLPDCRVELRAVLVRMPHEMGRVRALKPDQVLPLPAECLQRVRLETQGGRLVGRARLGQFEGKRALRLSDGEAPSPGNASLPRASSPGGAVSHDLPGEGLPGLPDAPTCPASFVQPEPVDAFPNLPELPDPASLPDLPPLP